MSSQPSLFGAPPRLIPRKKGKLTLDERFEAWVKANPHIVARFLRFAREAQASGRRRFGIGMIAERVRWYTYVESKEDGYRVNNSYRSRLARLLVERDPSLAGMFEFRKLTSKRVL